MNATAMVEQRAALVRFDPPRSPPIGIFWLFVLPFAALTAVFGVWPIILSIQTSFTASASALKPNPTWVGFANYVSIFADPVFVASLWRTLLYTALAVVSTIAFALLYALLLNSTLIDRGRTWFKLAIFLPVVTPDIAGYVVWRRVASEHQSLVRKVPNPGKFDLANLRAPTLPCVLRTVVVRAPTKKHVA